MISSLIKTTQKLFDFKECFIGCFILSFATANFIHFNLMLSIISFCSLISIYYYIRMNILKLALDKHQYKLICPPTVKQYFIHPEIPALIEKTINEIAKKYNYKTIPVEIIDSDEDGAFCSYYTNNTYQIELTTYALYNLGAIPGKKLNNKSKKRLKAILAHEYGHFYYNDGFMMEFILLTKLFVTILFLINLKFALVFIPFFLTSLYSKFIEYRADYFSWKTFPEALYCELKEANKEENKNILLIDYIRLSLFGSHPFYPNRIRFINYMKAKK